LLALLAGCAIAQRIVRPASPLTGYWDARLAYDNNVFRCSETDLAEFRTGLEPLRYPMRSADDLGLVFGAGWRYRLRPAGRTLGLSLRGRLHQYVSNTEKSYGFIEAEVDRRVSGRVTLKGSALWLPSYLIRYYRDPRNRPGPNVACRFSELLLSAGAEVRAGRARFEPRYRLQYDDYLVPFDYYDTKAHRFGAGLHWQALRSLELRAGYDRRLAFAQGPDPDISYRGHDFEFRALLRPARTGLDFGCGYDLGLRDYTAAQGLAHAGRKDAKHELGLEAGYRLGAVRFRLRYEAEWRNVGSPDPSVEDLKAYRQMRLVLGVRMDPQEIGGER